MENSQTIPLVAIAIALVAIGLSFVSPIILQPDIGNLSNEQINQANVIRSLTNSLSEDKEIIKSQNGIISGLRAEQNASQIEIVNLQDNITNLGNEINSLNSRISTLEQIVGKPYQCQYPECTQQKLASFPGAVGFYNVIGGGGQTENRVYKQLPAMLPVDNWTVDFDYKFTASNIPGFIIFALTQDNVDPQLQKDKNEITVEHGIGADTLFVETYPSGTASTGIPISPNVKYYLRLEANSTHLILNVFSDSARKTPVYGSPITKDIQSTDFTKLQYIQHDGCRDCGSGRELTAVLNNTKIYIKQQDDSEKVIFQPDYHSNDGWTQVGTSIVINGVDVSTQAVP